MDPGQALTVSLYDWLKYTGSELQPEVVASCFAENFSNSPKFNTTLSNRNATSFGINDDQINSCLAKDTGAREYAVMNQCNPGGVGQRALSKVFLIHEANELPAARANFPANALPLFINAAGYCNLAGRKGFDEKSVRDFLRDLYDTNLAALETVSTARSLHAQSLAILAQISQREVENTQELASLTNQLSRLLRDQVNQKGNHASTDVLPIRQTKERIADLQASLKADEAERKQNTKIRFLTALVQQNATRAQANTYEICANILRACRDGLFAMNWGGYLIGKDTVFMPITKPMTEADCQEAISANLINETYQPFRATLPYDPTDHSPETKKIREAQSKNPALAWIRKDLRIFLPPEQGFLEPNKVFVAGGEWQSGTQGFGHVESCMVVLNSADLQKGGPAGKAMPLIYGSYPFGNIALPIGQLLYYCARAADSGQQPTISWSVLARDFLAFHGQLANNNANIELTGRPKEASDSNWFKPSQFGLFQQSPGLACEFQIRTPLPVFEKAIEDSHLTNPVNNTQTAEVPPVPPDML
jgi:hypothetical protein